MTYIPPGGGGSVTSVFMRSGAVVAVDGDYDASQITNDSGVPGASISDALDAIDSEIVIDSVFGRVGAIVAVSGDYTTTLISNSSGVIGVSLTDALNSLNSLKANLASPNFTGVPTAPTAAPLTNTTQIATTAFVQSSLPSVPVSSVFSRVGNVVAAASDYNASQIDNDSGVSGAFVSDALNTLSTPNVGSVTGVLPIANGGTGQTTAQTARNALLPLQFPGTVLTSDGSNVIFQIPVIYLVFGRTGQIVAEPDDYAASLISNDTAVAGAYVSDALDTLNSLKANLASPTFTGIPAAPTAAALTNTTQIATTAFVTTADNLKANLASPNFTGVPTAPTAAPLTNTTQLATTAFVVAADTLKADLASPAFTGNPTAPTPVSGDNDTSIATTAFVQTELALYNPTITNLPGLVVAAAPTYTTVLTVPTVAETAYTATIIVDLADNPLNSIRAGRWIYQAAFHRNTAGNAVLDGVVVTTVGGFGSMNGTASASGNNIIFQLRFSTGATVNARVESKIVTLTPG